MKEGVSRLTTETGAGQWGSSLAFATALFDMDCTVYMVRVSYKQKPYRRLLMKTWGADVHPSPSDKTDFGNSLLGADPEHPGSLGIAISEALEDAFKHDDAKYSIGSVVNHVMLHQTVIGLETQQQFEMAEDYPDVMYGCVGGGSNYSGAAFPFVGDKLTGKNPDLDVVSCEPTACPSLTRGIYAYDFGDTAGMAPIVKMYTLGHDFVPPPIHAGGLRYHGDSPILCKLTNTGVMRAEAYHQKSVFDAAVTFARAEGFVVAPEAAHCVKGAIDEAIRCRETGEEKTIFFANSGHGHFDMAAYESYFENKLEDFELPQSEIDKALKTLPQI
jgi:tryptophan synthase beta chain